jgi:hypothetical protein
MAEVFNKLPQDIQSMINTFNCEHRQMMRETFIYIHYGVFCETCGKRKPIPSIELSGDCNECELLEWNERENDRRDRR